MYTKNVGLSPTVHPTHRGSGNAYSVGTNSAEAHVEVYETPYGSLENKRTIGADIPPADIYHCHANDGICNLPDYDESKTKRRVNAFYVVPSHLLLLV